MAAEGADPGSSRKRGQNRISTSDLQEASNEMQNKRERVNLAIISITPMGEGGKQANNEVV